MNVIYSYFLLHKTRYHPRLLFLINMTEYKLKFSMVLTYTDTVDHSLSPFSKLATKPDCLEPFWQARPPSPGGKI